MLGVQDKQNHTECKKVDNVALVWLTIQNFWSHVRGCSDHGVVETRAVSSFELGGETEIDNLGVEFLVEQDIFGFEITMGEAVGMEIVETHQNLFEVKSADLVAEGTGGSNEVEELAT